MMAWLIASIGVVLFLANVDNANLNDERGTAAFAYTLAGAFLIIGCVLYLQGGIS
jgi:hypothetical protein